MTLELFVLSNESGTINPSPFCVKLMTLFKVFKIDYTLVAESSKIRQNPKGKMPFIKDASGIHGDSRLIVESYRDQLKLDSTLTPVQKAVSNALIRTIEEHLYYYFLAKWVEDEEGFYKNTAKDMNWIIRPLFLRYLHYSTTKQIYSQGIGRLSPEEQLQLAKQDVESVETILKGSSTDYFFDQKQPGLLDIVCFSFFYPLLSMKHQFVCPKVLKLSELLMKEYYPKAYANLKK